MCEYFQSIKDFIKKNAALFFFLFDRKCFYPNYTKLSEKMIKSIGIIALRFKINAINIHRDLDIFNKCFLTVPPLKILKLYFIHNFIRQLTLKKNRKWKDICG